MTIASTLRARHNDPDRGSTAVELAVLAPLVLLVLGLMVAGGRIVTAQAHVNEAATTAARAATLARSPSAAQQSARRTADQALTQQGLHCQPAEIQADTSRFTATLGQAGQVRVTTTCIVSLSDLLVPGLPGTVRLPAEFSSPVDPFRGIALGFANSEGTVSADPMTGGVV